MTGRLQLPVWGPPKTTARKRTSAATWKLPMRWHRAALKAGVRRRVFVASLADVFEDHPDLVPWREEALAILAQCTALDVQLLTKRPENVRRMVPEAWLEHWPRHVWIGTTVEDQRRADERIPELLKVPAAVRFLSCEPLLGPVDLSEWIGTQSHCSACGESCDGSPDLCPSCGTDNLVTTWGYAQAERWQTGERYEDTPQGESDRTEGPGVRWVIVGGESGPDARPFAVERPRDIVRQCRDAGVAVFVKQMGDRPTTTLADNEVWPTHDPSDPASVQFNGNGFGVYDVLNLSHHGADPKEWPADLRVQEFPGGAP